MTVYVDELREYRKRPGRRFCHMVADTHDELHTMADKIGHTRERFQDHSRHPHYDLNETLRRRAVAAGAVPVSRRDLVAVLRRASAARAGRS